MIENYTTQRSEGTYKPEMVYGVQNDWSEYWWKRFGEAVLSEMVKATHAAVHSSDLARQCWAVFNVDVGYECTSVVG